MLGCGRRDSARIRSEKFSRVIRCLSVRGQRLPTRLSERFRNCRVRVNNNNPILFRRPVARSCLAEKYFGRVGEVFSGITTASNTPLESGLKQRAYGHSADGQAAFPWNAYLVQFRQSPAAMKQPSTIESASAPPPPPMGSVDNATLELLAAWKAEDATTDREKLRQADEEVAQFKKAMNENRAATGARLLFP